MTFTCIVGIIELLPEIKQPSFSVRAYVQQGCLSIIYFALLSGVVFSTYRVLGVYRESRKLALSGRLGEIIRKQAKNNRTRIDRFIDWPWCTPVTRALIVFAIIVFGLLYLARIGVL